MKKVFVKNYGAPKEVLVLDHDAVIPNAGAGEVVIRVMAASVNPIDCRMRAGYGRAIFSAKAQLPIVLGRDFSGTVLKVGDGVTQYKVGDNVWGVVSPFRSEGIKGGSYSDLKGPSLREKNKNTLQTEES